MLGELVRPSVERPRGSRNEVHANGESDRIQRRREVKRYKSGAWTVRKGGNRLSQVRKRALAMDEK